MMRTNLDEQEAELAIDQHIREIGRLIEVSRPERRNELRQTVSALMEQEVLSKAESASQSGEWTRSPMNPLALGLLLLVLGAGLFFLLPPVGLVVAFGGILGIIWGVFSSASPDEQGKSGEPGQGGEETEGSQDDRTSRPQDLEG
jgi:hypothetical protein